MEKNTERILKGNDVEISGCVQLGSITADPAGPAQAARLSASPQAEIIENTPDFALVEVTCPCGRKTRIKCEYVKMG